MGGSFVVIDVARKETGSEAQLLAARLRAKRAQYEKFTPARQQRFGAVTKL